MSFRLPPGILAFHRDQTSLSPNSNRTLLTRSTAVELVFLVGFSLMVFVSVAFSPCEAADNWNKLSPAVGIDLSVPGKVTTQRKDGKATGEIETYQSEDAKYVYVVTHESADSSSNVDDIITEVKKEILKDEFTKSTTPVDAQGNKWAGKRFQVSTEKGDSCLSLQVAVDNENEEVVSLTTSAPLDSPEAKRFFDSLQIDPEAIKAERSKKAEEFLKKFFCPNSVAGVFGLVFAVLGSISCIIGWVCLMIVAFRTSIWWGLAIFIGGGFGSLCFIVCNFQRSWPPLMLQFFGLIGVLIGCALSLPNIASGP